MLKNSIPASIEQRLYHEKVLWVSTTRPDGRPHMAPVWFLWEKEHTTILFCSKPDSHKVRNIRHSPAVMLALETAENGHNVVMLEGEATLLDDSHLKGTLPAYITKYADDFKEMNWEPEATVKVFSQPVRVNLTRLIHWSL
jgi:PPOX class probable F420-dependent enzyme